MSAKNKHVRNNQPAQPQEVQKDLTTGAPSYLTIQEGAAHIISSKRPRPHSSLNPLAGNSLY